MAAALRILLGLLLAAAPLPGATHEDNPDQPADAVPPEMRAAAAEATELFGQRRYNEAAEKYLLIIEQYPKSLHAWSNLGVTRFMNQQYDEAREAFESAIELAPDYPLAHEMLSITYYQKRDFPAAEAAARRALKINAVNTGALRALAMALAAQDRLDAARQMVANGLALEPDNPDLLKLQGILSPDGP